MLLVQGQGVPNMSVFYAGPAPTQLCSHDAVQCESHLTLPSRMLLPSCACLAALTTGGSGKTTLAKLLWNHFIYPKTYMEPPRADFDGYAFLSIDMESGTKDLQASLEGVLKQFSPWAPIQSPRSLSKQLADYVECHKVLYVLDNISYADQLEELLPTEFAAGSIVIVTSRYKDLPMSEKLQQVQWAAIIWTDAVSHNYPTLVL
jgi:hypothetical protein